MHQQSLIILDEAGLEAIVQRVLQSKQSEPLLKQEESKAKKLLTVDETCEFLSISRVTLHVWKKNGRLPYYRIGHRVYFKEVDIISALRSSTIARIVRN